MGVASVCAAPIGVSCGHPPHSGTPMTLCPIAVVAGCKKCPAFAVCPLKTVIGDMPKDKPAPPAGRKKK